MIRLLLILIIFCSCETKKNKSIVKKTDLKTIYESKVKQIDTFIKLNEKNAIPYLFDYSQKNLENKVRLNTEYGSIDILLYENTNIHRSNFIFLTKKKYFNGTIFHRVVPNFIIQGGNSDNSRVLIKRSQIGRYLLPPDTKKGNKHHRGVISMPSSDTENPHKLASPFEFFIVQQSSGAYHLDKDYTAFGKVIKGMDVVDKINKEPTDDRETPHKNIYITMTILQ